MPAAKHETRSGAGSWQTSVDIRRSDSEGPSVLDDCIVPEVAVALVYNGISHAVMMATPSDLDDFALGFSLSESIITDPAQFYGCTVREASRGLSLEIDIASECLHALKDKRRQLAGRSGCGLCGTESLDAAMQATAKVLAPALSDSAVQKALASLQDHQPLQAATGACHGAAWCNTDGDILLAREDVGRHNALDKLLGALAKKGLSTGDGFLLISSRASYEMVHKSCALGVGALVAVSAPTSLAIEQARSAGQLLIGFARQGRHVIYNKPAVSSEQ